MSSVNLANVVIDWNNISDPPEQGMRLETYLREEGLTHAEFAKRVGVSRSAVTQWVNGITMPSGVRMLLIHQLTEGRVGLEDWFGEGPRRKGD